MKSLALVVFSVFAMFFAPPPPTAIPTPRATRQPPYYGINRQCLRNEVRMMCGKEFCVCVVIRR